MASVSDRLGGLSNFTEIIIVAYNKFLTPNDLESHWINYKNSVVEEASYLNLIVPKLVYFAGLGKSTISNTNVGN